jgi:protein CWC15
MTTAHRPTFDPARGKEAARGEAYHQRLLPAHKTLKFRQQTQGTPDEQAKRDLKAELLKAEREHFAKKEGRKLPDNEDAESEDEVPAKALIEGPTGKKRKLDGDSSGPEGGDADGEVEDYEAKKRRVLEETKNIDASSSESGSEDDDEDSDSEDDSDDEEGALGRELAKIRAERAAATAKAAEEQAKRDAEQREKEIATGNPLLNTGKQQYGEKRRWDDDVVFKNQARGTEERGKEKRFVNDLLRSDFHRRFMDKYVR